MLPGTASSSQAPLAPAVDPIELAQLAQALQSTPEAASLSLTLALPDRMDPRVRPSLAGFTAGDISFASGAVDHTILVSIDITDTPGTASAGPVPAISKASMFLSQLTAPESTPLFGKIGVLLDSLYSPPMAATIVLNLGVVACSTDVAVSLPSPGSASLVKTSRRSRSMSLGSPRSARLG